MDRGLFVVLESPPGNGLDIQLNLLKERIKAIGYDVAVFDLPNFGRGSAYFIDNYQKGIYGKPGELSPYIATMFYALDRYEAAKDIEQALDKGKIVIASNYVGGGMAEQAVKFGKKEEQRGFFIWDDNLEYETLKLPRPDINVYIRPSGKLSAGKDQTEAFDTLCELFPKDFWAVDAIGGKDKQSVAKLNDKIWDLVKPRLPKFRPHPGHNVVVTLTAEAKKSQFADNSAPDRLRIPVKSGSLFLKTFLERYEPGCAKPSSFSWSENLYQVYVPDNLPKEVKEEYKVILRNIAKLHEAIKNKMASNALKNIAAYELLLSITPFFALASFVLDIDKSQARELCAGLLTQEQSELQWLAKQIYVAAKQKWPKDFAGPIESETDTGTLAGVLSLLPAEKISANNPPHDSVKVLDVNPRQEFDLLAESIYPYSNLSLREITDAVADWPYSQKYQSLLQAVRQPGILNKVSYKMDIISDHLKLSRLAKAAGLRHIQAQAFTPRYGYDVDLSIEDAGLDDLYIAAFDESLKLYSLFQSAGRDDLSPYAALVGHKVRWQLDTSAANLKSAFDTKDGSGYNQLISDITQAVSEIHPLLWHILSGTINDVAAKAIPQDNSRVKPYHRRKRRPGSKR